MDEREAIARLRAGDTGGLAPLVRSYYVPALRAAYGVTRDHALAEDVVQEAFLRASERIGQFDSARPFGPWFLRSVVNAAISAARRAETLTSWDALDARAGDARPGASDPDLGPEVLVAGAETRAELWAALGQLAPEQRGAIIRRYYLDMTEREIAAAQGSPAGTIKWRLHAARARLRELLRPSQAAGGATKGDLGGG